MAGLANPSHADSGDSGVEASSGSEHSVISIFLSGGFSQIDSFDPKPGSVADQPFGTIQTRTPGIIFSDRFPLLAGLSDQITVVRSMTHGENDHIPSQRYWRTGRTDAGSEDPSLGAIIAHHSGWRIPPAYVAIPTGQTDAGFLGAACSPYVPQAFHSPAPDAAGPGTELLRRRFSDVIGSGRPHAGSPATAVSSLAEARRRAESIQSSALMRGLADFGDESSGIVDGYGTSDFGRHLLMARRLAAAGSRFVRVELGGWDHHQNLAKSFAAKSDHVDRALSGLISDLTQSGLSERVLVMVSTEFGRTPRMAGPSAAPGRDHFGRAYCGLLAGGSTADRPRWIGKTDAGGSSVDEDPVSPSDWWITACHWAGLNPDRPELLPDDRKLNVSGRSLLG